MSCPIDCITLGEIFYLTGSMCPLDWMVWMIHFHSVECDDIHDLYMGIFIHEIMSGLFHLSLFWYRSFSLVDFCVSTSFNIVLMGLVVNETGPPDVYSSGICSRGYLFIGYFSFLGKFWYPILSE